MPNLMKIRSVGAELFHADGRTDRQTDIHDDTNSRFSDRNTNLCGFVSKHKNYVVEPSIACVSDTRHVGELLACVL